MALGFVMAFAFGFVAIRLRLPPLVGYLLAGIAPANPVQGVQRQFVAAIRSFRSLSRSEAAEIKPNHVDIYTVRNGDTWQEIAERVARNTVKPTTLAIMNNYDPGQPPRPGDRIKVVVEG